ncbi:MAG: UDP-3-O-(3-hydroxymyristoyl)glucosamine N-acyltransferase [Pseudomonadales bacterium]|nr:UDP-3-O-(3-hydroxymyristoyl)glucosamine N-acyltransferase [Halioglobus sp.]MCP5131667.1 UDP-3-O-(3-hydroxymyristoyl)glucosamine N-acyltransferase [Pseudomonadales bacterium]
MYSLAELADRFGLEFTGDANTGLTGLATLADAGPADLAFLANSKYLSQLDSTRAGAVILSQALVERCPVACLIADDPYVAFARISALYDKSPRPAAGAHPSASVSPQADVHPSASIGPNVVVEPGAVLAEGVILAAGVYVGHNSHLGAGTRVMPNAVIHHDVRLGERCVIHAQAVLGADGFGFAQGPEGWERVCQLGGVRLGDRVEIGAGTTVDRGTLGHTVIADGVIIDNQVQVGHNCRIGKNTAIAGCTGLAGSTIIGAGCTLAGGVGVVGHVEICDNVHVTGMTMVTKSITRAGSYSSGTPMTSTRDWKRNAVRFSQLDSIQRRLAAQESRGKNIDKG